jgi:hypothetical protein
MRVAPHGFFLVFFFKIATSSGALSNTAGVSLSLSLSLCSLY